MSDVEFSAERAAVEEFGDMGLDGIREAARGGLLPDGVSLVDLDAGSAR